MELVSNVWKQSATLHMTNHTKHGTVPIMARTLIPRQTSLVGLRRQEPDWLQEAIAPCLSNGRITHLEPI
jgi:hypothetical protein